MYLHTCISICLPACLRSLVQLVQVSEKCRKISPQIGMVRYSTVQYGTVRYSTVWVCRVRYVQYYVLVHGVYRLVTAKNTRVPARVLKNETQVFTECFRHYISTYIVFKLPFTTHMWMYITVVRSEITHKQWLRSQTSINFIWYHIFTGLLLPRMNTIVINITTLTCMII